MSNDQLQRLLASSFDYYASRTTARLQGLSDDEYFWEPVPDCWSLRSTPDGWHSDWSDPPPEPAPVTTIAWRLAHLIYCLQDHGMRAVAFEGGKASWEPPTVLPPTAAAALEALAAAVDRWKSDLADLDPDRLWLPLGPEAGQYATDPVGAFVEHIHDEFIHHSAEVALLRDLYPRLSTTTTPQH